MLVSAVLQMAVLEYRSYVVHAPTVECRSEIRLKAAPKNCDEVSIIYLTPHTGAVTT
jgi:hypothetical protein